MSAAIVAAFLLGMVAGVFVLLAATGMFLAVRDWREAVREGTLTPEERGEVVLGFMDAVRAREKRFAEIKGIEMERNRKREES